jgi:hypothetical protein
MGNRQSNQASKLAQQLADKATLYNTNEWEREQAQKMLDEQTAQAEFTRTWQPCLDDIVKKLHSVAESGKYNYELKFDDIPACGMVRHKVPANRRRVQSYLWKKQLGTHDTASYMNITWGEARRELPDYLQGGGD